MSATSYYDNIQKHLFAYADLVAHSNSLGLSNGAVHAENLFCVLLNKAFGWNLVNANAGDKNRDSIDLIDEEKKLAIQVTSNKSYTAKITKTLATFRSNPANANIQRLIILFISRRCPKSVLKEVHDNGFIYEVYDIPKLLSKIYYEAQLPAQLKEINQILEEAIAPVLLNSPNTVRERITAPPVQVVATKKSGIYIERKKLTRDMFTFAQAANGLIIGGPGAGKSFTIAELQKLCHKKQIPCFVIRINELIDGTDEEINKELSTGSHWLKALTRTPFQGNDFKGLLIFDAFDTAKDERAKTRILKQIKEAIHELKDKWNILVSVRIFEAEKSTQLRELFPKKNVDSQLKCRSITIPDLSDAEFDLAAKKDKKLYHAIQKCTTELKSLLKIPYFLKLLEEIITGRNPFKTENLIYIETEQQLLAAFWKAKIATQTNNDIFLDKLTLALITNGSLSCSKREVLTESNSATFDNLISLGIMVESSATKQNISYSHNILLEYAVARYLIPENINKLFTYLDKNEKLPFLFRQSFIYFYSKLWDQDRSLFWQHYFSVRKKETPLFRLYHQTILNYILGGYYKSEQDLFPVFDTSDAIDKANTIRKILEGIRFISKEKTRQKDILLFAEISKSMHEIFLWEFGLLINQAIKAIAANPDKILYAAISKVALNYMAFVLEARKTSSYKSMLETNGAHWGTLNLCQIIGNNKQAASRQIKQILELLKEPDFPLRFFYILTDNLPAIFKANKKLGLLIYETLYRHSENNDTQTILGGSVVINLRSTRRQDFQMIHHNLEKSYSGLIQLYPALTIPLGLKIANQYSARRYFRGAGKPFLLNIGGIQAKLYQEYSYFGSDDDREFGPMSHVQHIFKYLEQLIQEKKHTDARKVMNIVFSNTESGVIWGIAIKFLTHHPAIFKKQVIALLHNPAILLSDETNYEAGELIRSVWSLLTTTQKQLLESTIVSLTTSRLLKEPEAVADRVKRLLSCIPTDQLTPQVSGSYMNEINTVKNEPRKTSSILQAHYQSTEEKIRDMGVNAADTNEFTAYMLIQAIMPFNDKYDYNNSDSPPPAEYEPLMLTVTELLQLRKKHTTFSRKLLVTCDNTISRFAKLVARNKKLDKATRTFVETIAHYYIAHDLYILPEYQVGNITERFNTHSPTPRTEAAETMVQLLDADSSGTLAPLVLQLMNDNVPFIRFKALHAAIYYWENYNSDFWHALKERAGQEKDTLCIRYLISSICNDNIVKADQQQVEELALILVENFKNAGGIILNDIWKSYVVLLLRLVIRYNSQVAADIIHVELGIQEFANQLLFQILRNIMPPGEKNNYVAEPEKYTNLIHIVHAIIAFRFKAIAAKGWNNESANDDFKIIDSIVQKLFFSLTDGKKSVENQANKIAYFIKIKPLLSVIVDESLKIGPGFMVGRTGFYFMQLLNSMLYADPEYVLTLSSAIVTCAAANGFTYDQTTLGQIVHLTEKILADHKELLSDSSHFKSLITILDLFANSGWQEALELTWRLRDAF